VLCKLTHYAVKRHRTATLKLSTPEKHRKSAVSKLIYGQSIQAFGEGLAIYPLLVGSQDNAPEYRFLEFVLFPAPFQSERMGILSLFHPEPVLIL
jgi:hypothetical protein